MLKEDFFMKENAIKRINTLGKIGAIVAKIAKILMNTKMKNT